LQNSIKVKTNKKNLPVIITNRTHAATSYTIMYRTRSSAVAEGPHDALCQLKIFTELQLNLLSQMLSLLAIGK